MLAGAPPSFGDGLTDPRLTEDEATIAVDRFDPALRDGLTVFFSRALRRDPAERFGNAEEMHAKARDYAYRGRKPSFTREQLDQVRDMLTTGTSISTIAKTTGLSRQAIYRLKDDPAWAESVLTTWAA